MSTTKTELRRCVGSSRFGIDPHDAPISDFPKQASQKDGLGRMCKEHWKQYASGLRRDAQARKAGEATTKAGASDEATTGRSRKRASVKPSASKAEALVGDVGAMPTDEVVTPVGEAEVQPALETSAVAGKPAD